MAKGGARSRLFEGLTLSNRDLLHSALMGSDNRAIPALGRAVKLTPPQLTTAMNAKARALGLKSTRFHEPTGLSTGNVSTPREIITMLRAVMANQILAPITRRAEYDAHPVGKPPIHYNNTNHPAARGNVQVLGGKTGYNDEARYCLVVATKIDGRNYYMAFLGDDGKMTRFGDVARVADWIISHPQKLPPPLKPAPPVPFAPPPEQEPVAAAPAGAGRAGGLGRSGQAAGSGRATLGAGADRRRAHHAAGPAPGRRRRAALGGRRAAVHARRDALRRRHAVARPLRSP